MDIIWDNDKDNELRALRGISFEDVVRVIRAKRYDSILEHPSHPDQMIFIVLLVGLIHVVPFFLDANDNIVLKTIFRSTIFQDLFDATGTP